MLARFHPIRRLLGEYRPHGVVVITLGAVPFELLTVICQPLMLAGQRATVSFLSDRLKLSGRLGPCQTTLRQFVHRRIKNAGVRTPKLEVLQRDLLGQNVPDLRIENPLRREGWMYRIERALELISSCAKSRQGGFTPGVHGPCRGGPISFRKHPHLFVDLGVGDAGEFDTRFVKGSFSRLSRQRACLGLCCRKRRFGERAGLPRWHDCHEFVGQGGSEQRVGIIGG